MLAGSAACECGRPVVEGCPARTGARLAEAAMAATHSKSAGALTEEACRADKKARCDPQVPLYHKECKNTFQISHRRMDAGLFLPISKSIDHQSVTIVSTDSP